METGPIKSLEKVKDFVIKRDLLLSLVIAVCVIASGLFIGWYNNKVVPTNPTGTSHYLLESRNPLKILSNWDGPDYLKISRHGYTTANDTNFFPLYPLLTHIVRYVIDSTLVSALIVAWTGFWFAIYFYLKILKEVFEIKSNLEAIRGLLFFVLFPTAVFMLATYTEGIFAAFSLASIYYALKRNYIATAGFAVLATACHLNGIFLLPLVFLILIEQGANWLKALLSAACGSLGLIGYMVYLEIKFKHPLAFITAQQQHGWLKTFHNFVASANFISLLFLILLLITAAYWWKKRKSFSVYTLLYFLTPFVGKQFGGFNRYVLMAFPLPLMLYGYLRNKRTLFPVAICLSAIAWTYFMLQYAGGYVGG